MSEHESTAARAGIVDQQDAALEQLEQDQPTPPGATPAGDSAAARAGIVDQQDAALEQMERPDPAG